MQIDLKDAFGQVDHKKVFKIMKDKGFSKNFIKMIKASYKDATTQFQVGAERSREVFQNKGVYGVSENCKADSEMSGVRA